MGVVRGMTFALRSPGSTSSKERDMTTTWVVVAHQSGARFMVHRTEHRPGTKRTLELLRELENPDGRKKNHEIETDRSGDSFTGARGLGARRAMHHEHSAHDHVVERFARTIAGELEHARSEGRFDGLILVASPKLLGLLRSELDSATAQRVVASVHKDLAEIPDRDVVDHISDVLPL
jgi:protein required for attachment to host cells